MQNMRAAAVSQGLHAAPMLPSRTQSPMPGVSNESPASASAAALADDDDDIMVIEPNGDRPQMLSGTPREHLHETFTSYLYCT